VPLFPYDESMQFAVTNGAPIRRPIGLIIVVAVVGTGIGVSTAYAQAWLPDQLGSLANSSGSWCLVAALLALLATSQLRAAISGALALSTLLGGYVLGAASRGDHASTSLIAFWVLAALVVGPLLGVAAFAVKSKRSSLSAGGAGGISGLLVGEGVYGLRYIAGTTYPPYWWAEIMLGVLFLGWAVTQRLRRPNLIAIAVGVNLLIAAAYLVATRQDLISLFP
jgi:hypothetical protein